MQAIVLSNKKDGSLSKVNLDDYSKSILYLDEKSIVRPSALKAFNGKIIAGCEYGEKLYLINEDFKIEEEIDLSVSSNDIEIYEDKVYLSCSDINSLLIVDLKSKEILVQIPLDSYPFSIALDKSRGYMYVSSYYGNSISIIDCKSFEIVNKVYGLSYPTKILISRDGNYIYICESMIGIEEKGAISMLSIKTMEKVNSLEFKRAPIDMVEDNNKIYTINLESGNLNIIDFENYYSKNYKIGFMPIKILKKEKDIFVCDYYTGYVKMLDLKEKKIKIIAKSNEPSAMIFL